MVSAIPAIVGDLSHDILSVTSKGSFVVGVDATESGTLPIDLTVDGLVT